MKETELTARLRGMGDETFARFQARLLPTVAAERILGVKTPELKKLAKSMAADGAAEAFLQTLPHTYFEENQLHAFLLSDLRDFDACLAGVETFLPFVDNWATCDQLCPRSFPKHAQALLPSIERWLASAHTYTVRFAVGALMRYFLDERFSPRYAQWAAQLRSEEYYINMMVAWYFATALAKQYDAVLPFLEQRRLAPWTHNKAIQKCVESRRITDEQKAYLKKLKQ